ncbi:hypothetical protein HDU97_010055 [Phlyctochytrium planicorne]|nr:hypothetical protein HDU97_010055 [Phlyctochytrium planicorne]
MVENLAFATLSLHADSEATLPDVAPAIHVSTTYKYGSDWNEKAAVERGLLAKAGTSTTSPSALDETKHIYSRESLETRERVETVLGALEKGHAITYSSGLSAVTAAFNFYQPRRIIISKEGYHGTHGVLDVYKRGRDYLKVIHFEDGFPTLEAGDLIWVESPQNPRGETYDIEEIKSKCPEGAILAVDATFAPPPLQQCLLYGADVVMHSSTKFLGGHSDLLGGVLVVRDGETAAKLQHDRTFLGSNMGNLETWLLLRSLRTLEVRVRKQSETATQLSHWLAHGDRRAEPYLAVVLRIWHGSIETTPGHSFLKRVKAGYSGVLAIEFATADYARLVVSNLKLFKNATSLGGVESLIEWRAAVDPKIDPKICRVSIGLEDIEDLKKDLKQAFIKMQDLARKA